MSAKDTQLLVYDGGLHHFKLTITDKQDASITGYVQQVIEWRKDKPYDFGDYFRFYIKWDGDLHIDFGDAGNLTLFGPLEVAYHCRLMKELYQWAQQAVPIIPEEWMKEDA